MTPEEGGESRMLLALTVLHAGSEGAALRSP